MRRTGYEETTGCAEFGPPLSASCLRENCCVFTCAYVNLLSLCGCVSQEFMDNFRKLREEEEAKREAKAEKKEEEEAEAEEVSAAYREVIFDFLFHFVVLFVVVAAAAHGTLVV